MKPVDQATKDHALRLLRGGLSKRAVARLCGLAYNTVEKIQREATAAK